MHPPSSPLRPRLTVLSILVVVLFVALSSRLWYLQVLAGERYGDLAEGNRVRQVVVEAPRGRILDAKGRVVVRNRAAWAVTVKPTEPRHIGRGAAHENREDIASLSGHDDAVVTPLATEFLSDRAENLGIDVRKRAIEEGFGGSIGHGRAPQLECAKVLSFPCGKGNTKNDIC